MAVVKFLNILTVVSLAVLYASFDARVNALSVERGLFGRDLGHAHAEIAKKRGDSQKCRPRPSSVSSSLVTSTYAKYAASTHSSEPAKTTSSSQPASTNAPASSISSKVMYGFSNNEQPSIPNFLTNVPRLIYNWKLTKYSDIDIDSVKNVQFVPTAHSRDDVYNIGNVLKKGYANYVKFLNEPDVASQANVSPEEAHTLWTTYFQPLGNQGYKLIGPSIAGNNAWMKSFLSLCNGGCNIYALDLHYYGLRVEDFQSAVSSYHALLPSVPLWITEVGCHDYSGKGQVCDQGTFNAFFPGVMNFVESTSYIEQVAWFGLFTSSEMPMGLETVNTMITCSGNNKDCKPNNLGYQFINYH